MDKPSIIIDTVSFLEKNFYKIDPRLRGGLEHAGHLKYVEGRAILEITFRSNGNFDEITSDQVFDALVLN